ncbi:MAG: hypothetical protein F6J95_023930 [Leptolyngbya sp. SIO1E4]|nr:hypothetical protein [Leptolyngbya sp. SIO1E4]
MNAPYPAGYTTAPLSCSTCLYWMGGYSGSETAQCWRHNSTTKAGHSCGDWELWVAKAEAEAREVLS